MPKQLMERNDKMPGFHHTSEVPVQGKLRRLLGPIALARDPEAIAIAIELAGGSSLGPGGKVMRYCLLTYCVIIELYHASILIIIIMILLHDH